jgi:hypothetical protein
MANFPAIFHFLVATLFLITWCVAVALIAYGSEYGSKTGSMFLEVWACLYISLDVATTNFVLLFQKKQDDLIDGSEVGIEDMPTDETRDVSHSGEPPELANVVVQSCREIDEQLRTSNQCIDFGTNNHNEQVPQR